jgi:hypothetical protein
MELVLWRDKMGVPSQCAIVRTVGSQRRLSGEYMAGIEAKPKHQTIEAATFGVKFLRGL